MLISKEKLYVIIPCVLLNACNPCFTIGSIQLKNWPSKQYEVQGATCESNTDFDLDVDIVNIDNTSKSSSGKKSCDLVKVDTKICNKIREQANKIRLRFIRKIFVNLKIQSYARLYTNELERAIQEYVDNNRHVHASNLLPLEDCKVAEQIKKECGNI